MADSPAVPPSPPQNLPTAGGSGDKGGQKKGGDDVQTMSDMIEAARRRVEEAGGEPEKPVAPQPQQKKQPQAPKPAQQPRKQAQRPQQQPQRAAQPQQQKKQPQAPKPAQQPRKQAQRPQQQPQKPATQPSKRSPQSPRSGALPNTGQKLAGTGLPKKPVAQPKKRMKPVPQKPQVRPGVGTGKPSIPMTPQPSMSTPSKPGKMIPIALIVMGLVELILAGGVGFLFMQSSGGQEEIVTTDQVKILEDKVYELEVQGQDIDTNTADIVALEETAKDYVTKEELSTELTNIADVTERASGDADKDGLSDYEEIVVIGTDPDMKDTDGDSFNDGAEVLGNYNPLGTGRAEGYSEAMELVVMQWDGSATKGETITDSVLSLEPKEDGTLTGTWEFTSNGKKYDAVITGNYTYVVATDVLTADVALALTSGADSISTTDAVLEGNINQVQGTFDGTIALDSGIGLRSLEGKKIDVDLSILQTTAPEDSDATDTESDSSTDTTGEDGEAIIDLMDSLPEDVATDTNDDATPIPPAVP